MNIDIQRKMKVYIAASYTRYEEAKKLGEKLEEKEFEVISNWHSIDRPTKPDYNSATQAIRDIFEVEHCDLFIELIGDKRSQGGRHCELGMALAWNKKVLLIGEIDGCIFENLPWLPRMKNIEQFLRIIN